jgi:hypothetical protein
MRAIVRRAWVAGLVGLGAFYVAWFGAGGHAPGDYHNDYAPAMDALLNGHVGSFFNHLPRNGAGGSVVLRAPAALVAKLLGGSQLEIFRAGALLCVTSLAGLGIALARQMGAAGRSRHAGAAVVALCVLTPAVLDAILFGHPEEPLGASLCVAAVLLAGAGRSSLAGIALGLAVINKPWGVLAITPVLLAAPSAREALAAGWRAAVIVGLWLAAAYAGSSTQFGRAVLGASTSVVAHPVDLWWPLAHLHRAPNVTPAYFPPQLVADHARELAVLLAIPLSIPLVRQPRRSTNSCLALLATLLLTRCLLDPSNHVYYQVPFVIALTAWEARSRGLPVLSLLATLGFFLVFHTVSGTGSLWAQYVFYLAVALPLLVVVARGAGIVLGRDRHRRGLRLPRRSAGGLRSCPLGNGGPRGPGADPDRGAGDRRPASRPGTFRAGAADRRGRDRDRGVDALHGPGASR